MGDFLLEKSAHNWWQECPWGQAIEEIVMMKCHQCQTEIEPGEEKEHRGLRLCEDCYMDALSPAKACDPWAVYAAKSQELHGGGSITLTPLQAEIVRILQETGGLEPSALLQKLEGKLTMTQFEREFATLRHMEKVRGEKREGKVLVRLW
jgi:hypothetical protein